MKKLLYILIVLPALIQAGCTRLVEVDPPSTSTNADLVYRNDATAAAILSELYIVITQDLALRMSMYPGLYADELKVMDGSTDLSMLSYQRNALTPISWDMFWSRLYQNIYAANDAIEGITKSDALMPALKEQLLGEAKFMRAFSYFYLVNLYGDVPLHLTTSYQENRVRPRTATALVYEQIITDLKEARAQLSENYVTSTMGVTEDRVRPNKAVAAALLARAYLYAGKYAEAEATATSLIEKKAVYDTVALDNVFLKNSKETIWAAQPTGNESYSNTMEGRYYVLPETGPDGGYPLSLKTPYVEDFETNDQRRTHWIKSVMPGSTIFYHAYKYKIGAVVTSTQEYSIILRLAEQYLIRAEARAQQENVAGAQQDVNLIRKRAGLPPTSAAAREALLEAVFKERKAELFTEWGHRFFDLKRFGKADEILGAAKGADWQSTDQLFPIPQVEIDGNTGVRGHQNPGYGQ